MNYIELYNSLNKLLSKHPDKFIHNDSQELIDSVLSGPKIDLHIYLNHEIFGFDIYYKYDSYKDQSIVYFKNTDLYDIYSDKIKAETKSEINSIYTQISNILTGNSYFANKNKNNFLVIPNTKSGIHGECSLAKKGLILNSVKTIADIKVLELDRLEKIEIK